MHRTTRTLFGRLFRTGPARRDDTAGRDPDNGGPTSKPDDSGTGDQGDSDKTPHITGDFDPDRAARTIAAARDGEKAAKAAAKQAQERLTAVLKAAGLTPDGKQDPAEQLRDALAERDKASTAARQSAVRLAVYQAAGEVGDPPRTYSTAALSTPPSLILTPPLRASTRRCVRRSKWRSRQTQDWPQPHR